MNVTILDDIKSSDISVLFNRDSCIFIEMIIDFYLCTHSCVHTAINMHPGLVVMHC